MVDTSRITVVALKKCKRLAYRKVLGDGLLLGRDVGLGLELRLEVCLLGLQLGAPFGRLAYVQLNILSRLRVKESLRLHLDRHVYYEILTRPDILQHLALGQRVGVGVS